MQKNLVDLTVKFIIKYIWLFCVVLIVLECISTIFSANILMKRTLNGVMQSVCGEVENRVDSILKLMTGLSNEDFISDTSQPIFDRAVSTYPLQQSYNLFMIGVTDEDGNVCSADETEPSEEKYNLMYRDYMQRLYSTGTYQITDPIVAGSDGETMNYTIAVPILKDGKVEGSVFGSIYFDEIQDILDRNASHKSKLLYLFGRDQTIISQTKDMPIGSTFAELSKKSIYLGSDKNTVCDDIQEQRNGNYWVFDSGRFYYIMYRNIPPANWSLLYCTDFFSMIQPLLPIMICKIIFYFALCFIVSMAGRKYLSRKLAAVNGLLNKMNRMQMELFKTDSSDYTALLDISQSGLVDQLTGLSTRTLFFSKMENWQFDGDNRGAVMFIDLDNLKSINDNYGHEAGDTAILCFAQILKKFEENYQMTSARYGGDEFILAVKDYDNDDMTDFVENLCAQMRSHIIVNDGKHVPINASIGIALYPQDGKELTDLICKADLALYESKHHGKNCCTFYSSISIT